MLPLNEVLPRFFAFCEIFVKLLTEVNELTTIYAEKNSNITILGSSVRPPRQSGLDSGSNAYTFSL